MRLPLTRAVSNLCLEVFLRARWSDSLRDYFLSGLLALLPLFITLQVLSIVFVAVDGVLGKRTDALLSMIFDRPVHVPGLGLMLTALLVLVIGFLAKRIFFKRIIGAVESGIERLPVVRSLYNASRQIVAPFTGGAKQPFQRVVLVEYPMVGRWTLGLVAKEHASAMEGDDRLVVFFPSNHLHLGYPVIMSRHEVVDIDMSVEEAIKFFVSCGVVGHEKLLMSGGVPIPSPTASRFTEMHPPSA